MFQVFIALALVAQAAQTADRVKVTSTFVTEIDLGKLKGALVRQLAWSPDGTELYLMTYDANRDASVKEAFHFVLPVAGGAPKRVDAQPEWAVAYWKWKSDRFAPGDQSLAIEVSQEKKRQDTVAIPFGGELARGGTVDPGTNGTSQEAAIQAARAMENNNVYTLRLKGEIVGEWVNHPIVPGLTFGWAPAKTGLIAYAEQKSGRLVIMDKAGTKQRVNDTKGVVLPAWTDDGARLAYLEGRGRNKFALFVATVDR